MKKHSLLALTILILTFFFHNTKNVSAVELLTNGGFETAGFAPWVSAYSGCTDNGISYGPAQNATTFSPGFGGTTLPFAGTRALFHGFTCGPLLAPGAYYPGFAGYTIYQDVTVPAATMVTLQFSERLYSDLNLYAAPDYRSARPQVYRVEIRNTSNVVLATPFTVTAPANTTTNIPWTSHSFNLGNTYAGQTIRLAFVWQIATGLAGPGNVGLDAVSLNALPVLAAEVSVGGRITAANGQNIRNVVISLTESNGQTRTTRTNAFGYYNFDGIEVGQNVTLTVNSKRYTFANPTQVISVNENVAGVDFTAIE